MRKRRIIPTLPVNFFEDTDNKTKYQKMLYSSILDGVEQTLENGKPSFIMMRVDDGRNLKDVSVLKESFKSNLENEEKSNSPTFFLAFFVSYSTEGYQF